MIDFEHDEERDENGFEEKDTFLTIDEFLHGVRNPHMSWYDRSWVMSSVVAGTLALSIILNLYFVFPRNQSSINQFDQFSPALSSIQGGYHTVNFNDTTKFEYRGPVNEEVNARWHGLLRGMNRMFLSHRLTTLLYPIDNHLIVGLFAISEGELRKTGASKASVRLPSQSGGEYVDYLNAFHNLHCLVNNHKGHSTFWNMSSERVKDHVGHCIDILRQDAMCNADTTVMTYDWFEGISKPIAHATNPGKCRGWSKVYRWAKEYQVNAPSGGLTKPPDAVQRKIQDTTRGNAQFANDDRMVEEDVRTMEVPAE
ncbi:hypothetical protein MMC15_006343 [Xylographa vitiligo]|nr:hypothetical protein [Xylographa vitiligo]